MAQEQRLEEEIPCKAQQPSRSLSRQRRDARGTIQPSRRAPISIGLTLMPQTRGAVASIATQ